MKATKRADGYWYIEDARGMALFAAIGERNEYETQARRIEQNEALRRVLVRLLDALDDALAHEDALQASILTSGAYHEARRECQAAGLKR